VNAVGVEVSLKKKIFFSNISRSVFSFSVTMLIIKNEKPKFFLRKIKSDEVEAGLS
jgi:hypothetical protein